MSADVILRAIVDCEVCGEDWPRLCDEHRDAVEDWLDEQEEERWRQERAGYGLVTVGP